MFFRAGRDETMSCDTYRRDARYRLGSTRTVSVLCVGATEESTQSGTEWSPNVASGASTRSVRRSTSNLRWRKICDGEARDGQSGTVRLLKNETRVPGDDASVRRAAARRRRAGPSGRRKRAESRRNASFRRVARRKSRQKKTLCEKFAKSRLRVVASVDKVLLTSRFIGIIPSIQKEAHAFR